MEKNKLTVEQRAEIVNMYLAGMPQADVANKIGVSNATVVYHLHRAGIRVGRGNKNPFKVGAVASTIPEKDFKVADTAEKEKQEMVQKNAANACLVVGDSVITLGILRIAAADVVADLEREGYNTVVFDFEAAAVGAPHRRERVFFVGERKSDYVADSDSERLQGRNGSELYERANQRFTGPCCAFLRHTTGEGLQDRAGVTLGMRKAKSKPERSNRWPSEPNVGRVANGVPNRVDRIKCLGNAVVPAQAYPIFAAIADVIMAEQWAGDAREVQDEPDNV